MSMSAKVLTVMSRAKRGLHTNRLIQFGNKVCEDGGNESRRISKPNVQRERFFSLLLDCISVNVTKDALRRIDKEGIDEYLLKTPDCELDESAVFWKQEIAAEYQNMEIPIPNAEEGASSMEVFADALPSVGDSSQNDGKPTEIDQPH